MCYVRRKQPSFYIMYIVWLTRDLHAPRRYGCCLRIVRGRIRPNRSRSAGMFSQILIQYIQKTAIMLHFASTIVEFYFFIKKRWRGNEIIIFKRAKILAKINTTRSGPSVHREQNFSCCTHCVNTSSSTFRFSCTIYASRKDC